MGDTHNIFISWSKPRAKGAALALRDWLPRVIQATKPWMSETDIEKGKPWLDELMGVLGGLKLGIVCLTPEGLSEPWVLFEVGVICRALDPETRIWTYLLSGLRPSDVPQPLGMFQHTVATKQDTLKLLHSVNQAMGERGVSEEILKDQFELRWNELDEKLRNLPVPSGPVPSDRTNEDMFREIVEAVRAGASKDALLTDALALLGRMSRMIEANEARVPLSGFSGLSSGAAGNLDPWVRAGIDADDRAARASQIRSLREDMEQEKRAQQAKEEQQKGEGRRRMHVSPSPKRAGEQGKTGDEKK